MRNLIDLNVAISSYTPYNHQALIFSKNLDNDRILYVDIINVRSQWSSTDFLTSITLIRILE